MQESFLYNGSVKVSFSEANHRYYLYIKDQSGTWGKNTFPSGVTSILSTLYDQRGLMDWYSSTTAKAIVTTLRPDYAAAIDKQSLEAYKGATPTPLPVVLNDEVDLMTLYQVGIDAPHVKAKYGTDVGTQTHNAVDHYHKTGQHYIKPSGDPINDAAALKSFNAYVKWFESSGLEVIASEVVVASIRHNYSGTLDRIYRNKQGGLIMGDFKTSNLSRSYPLGIHAQYWSQLGAYMVAYLEEHGGQFVDAVIVNSPKKGSIKIGYASDMGLSPIECQSIWLDDLKAMNNHKRVEKALKTLKSRIGE